MSKEMTPKDALQMIKDNLTQRILGILTVEFNIVEKALNSVEETNFNYHNALAFCEASKEEKQELYKQIKQLERENQELRNKLNINFEDCADELCEALTQRDKLYDGNLELQKENQWLKELIKEYKRLKELANQVIEKFQIGNKNLTEENEKDKKVIEILKKKVNILARCIPYYNYKAMHSAGKITDEELEVLESV